MTHFFVENSSVSCGYSLSHRKRLLVWFLLQEGRAHLHHSGGLCVCLCVCELVFYCHLS